MRGSQRANADLAAKCACTASRDGHSWRRLRAIAPGPTRSISPARLAMCTLCARQPVTMGESSITRPPTRSGRLQAAIRLTRPPSEWPTSIAPARSLATMKSVSWSRSRGQLLVTG